MASVANDFAIWKGLNVEIVHIPYKYRYKLWIETFWNPDLVYAVFSEYWHYSIYIGLIYIFVIRALEKVMENRKAFELKNALFLWNTSLALFSIIGAWRSGEEFLYVVMNRPLTHTVCYSMNPTQPVSFWACAFALSKVAELFDTVFLVLRKRKVIFLHWYHHVVVLVYSWNSAIELTAAGRWFVVMNYSVHSIMYSYYAISCLNIRFPKVVAMTVTILQTMQMLIGVSISCLVYYLRSNNLMKRCQQSYENLILCFTIYISFALLFMKFFIQSYFGRKRKLSKEKAE
uniref:Elongation of very long chain fatty acids protein n=1 Tax=Rhabditophanes sp. KR3021 TaxID=114890 RepID=A0AC35U881_9BILA